MALSHLLDTTPPWLLTTAACGGLRSAPDHRTRRALLHLSYSCAAPVPPAMLVTHDPERKCGPPPLGAKLGKEHSRKPCGLNQLSTFALGHPSSANVATWPAPRRPPS